MLYVQWGHGKILSELQTCDLTDMTNRFEYWNTHSLFFDEHDLRCSVFCRYACRIMSAAADIFTCFINIHDKMTNHYSVRFLHCMQLTEAIMKQILHYHTPTNKYTHVHTVTLIFTVAVQHRVLEASFTQACKNTTFVDPLLCQHRRLWYCRLGGFEA